MYCNPYMGNLFRTMLNIFCFTHHYIPPISRILLYLFILTFNVKIYNRYCVKGGFTVSKKQNQAPKRKSKRERRMKLIVYLMVIAMILSLFTAGIGGLF